MNIKFEVEFKNETTAEKTIIEIEKREGQSNFELQTNVVNLACKKLFGSLTTWHSRSHGVRGLGYIRNSTNNIPSLILCEFEEI